MCEIACFLFLLFASVKDIQTRQVSVLLLIVAGLSSLIYQIHSGDMNWAMILGGAAVGGVFLLISKVTREELGYGDSIGILILGIFLGFLRVLTVISITFFLLLCISIPMLWRKKMSKKYALPFYPILTMGYLCMLWIEGINR